MRPVAVTLTADGRCVVWNAKDTIDLRTKHGIVGGLSGALAGHALQTRYFGLPLQLAPEEVTWLLENQLAVLVAPWRTAPAPLQSDAPDAPDAAKAEIHVPYQSDESCSVTLSEARQLGLWHFPATAAQKNRYNQWKRRHESGLLHTGAAKFGARWLAYPADPFLVHSDSVAGELGGASWRDVAALGRLANQVRKSAILVDNDGAAVALAWAGTTRQTATALAAAEYPCP